MRRLLSSDAAPSCPVGRPSPSAGRPGRRRLRLDHPPVSALWCRAEAVGPYRRRGDLHRCRRRAGHVLRRLRRRADRARRAPRRRGAGLAQHAAGAGPRRSARADGARRARRAGGRLRRPRSRSRRPAGGPAVHERDGRRQLPPGRRRGRAVGRPDDRGHRRPTARAARRRRPAGHRPDPPVRPRRPLVPRPRRGRRRGAAGLALARGASRGGRGQRSGAPEPAVPGAARRDPWSAAAAAPRRR